jgi:hypothetical protein
MAEVAAIRRTFALGWVEKDGKYEPTSWNVSDGTVWTGGCADNLVAPWTEPTPPPFKIEKPGFYRARDNRRVEVMCVRDGYAVGFDNTSALTWLVDGRHWNWASGTEGSSRSLDLVAPWREPVSRTLELRMVRGLDDLYVYLDDPTCSPSEHLVARRLVTITEGEGMP